MGNSQQLYNTPHPRTGCMYYPNTSTGPAQSIPKEAMPHRTPVSSASKTVSIICKAVQFLFPPPGFKTNFLHPPLQSSHEKFL